MNIVQIQEGESGFKLCSRSSVSLVYDRAQVLPSAVRFSMQSQPYSKSRNCFGLAMFESCNLMREGLLVQ